MLVSGTESTVEFLLKLIRKDHEIPDDDPDFGPEVDLFHFAYLDSFGIVELIEKVDEVYGVDLTELDFYSEGLRNVGGIATYIDAHRAQVDD